MAKQKTKFSETDKKLFKEYSRDLILALNFIICIFLILTISIILPLFQIVRMVVFACGIIMNAITLGASSAKLDELDKKYKEIDKKAKQ